MHAVGRKPSILNHSWSATVVALFCATARMAQAQPVWGDVGVELGSFMVSDAWAMCTCPPGGGGSIPSLPVGDACGSGGISDFWCGAFQWAQVGTPPCFCRSIGDALLRVDGIGTNTLRVRFDAVANANHDCVSQCAQGQCNCPSDYKTGASAIIDYGLMPDIVVDGPPLTFETVTISYRWSQMSGNMARPEAPDGSDDESIVAGTFAQIDRVGSDDDDGLGGSEFNSSSRGTRREGGSGSFTVSVESGVLDGHFVIRYLVGLLVEIKPGARGQQHPCLEYDSESVASGLEVVLTLSSAGGPPVPVPDPCPAPELHIGLRIGSDIELSDPTPDGNEACDPGDGYAISELALPAALPPGGLDGIHDDTPLFGFDMAPDPPDGPPPSSGAPTCSGVPLSAVQTSFLERDAMDQIDFSLAALIATYPQDILGALITPIPRSALAASCCVPEAQYLAISYADKSAAAYVACDTPVTTASPLAQTYGSPLDDDEVIGLAVVPASVGPGLPPIAAAPYALYDEDDLGLGPAPPPTPPFGPPPAQDFDDDVNILNAVAATGPPCDIELLSVSHEAAGPPGGPPGPDGPPPFLNPGHIYEFDPAIGGPPVLAVSKTIHLGLPPTVDIDALEVAWVRHDAFGESLAVLFSVDDDNPATAGDESGGLFPDAIYYSFLDGVSDVFIAGLHDNVDAITAYDVAILPPNATVPGCATFPGDLDGDGDVDGNDIAPFIACVTAPAACMNACADMDLDGAVGLPDAECLASLLVSGSACPPVP